MFNRTGFNKTKFNRPSGATAITKAFLGRGIFSASSRVVNNIDLTLHGEGSFSAKSRGLFSAIFKGSGSFSASAKVFKTTSAGFSGKGSFNPVPTFLSNTYFNFSGTLEAGSVIIIDTKRKTVKKNNKNGLSLFSGEFFNLKPGGNEIVYKDTVDSRQLNYTVSCTEAYV